MSDIIYRSDVMEAFDNLYNSLGPDHTFSSLPFRKEDLTLRTMKTEMANKTKFGDDLYKVLENIFKLYPKTFYSESE